MYNILLCRKTHNNIWIESITYIVLFCVYKYVPGTFIASYMWRNELVQSKNLDQHRVRRVLCCCVWFFL